MSPGSPSMCIRHTGRPLAIAADSAPSRRRLRTSLIMPAPAWAVAVITSGVLVSTETRASNSRTSASTTGTTRSSSCWGGTGSAPGRVDSPPTSMIAAPSASIRSAWRRASSGTAWRPPSEKESGVTLRIPMTRGKERSRRCRPHCRWVAVLVSIVFLLIERQRRPAGRLRVLPGRLSYRPGHPAGRRGDARACRRPRRRRSPPGRSRHAARRRWARRRSGRPSPRGGADRGLP